jgi:AbiV family abortive infection protein
MAMDDTSQKNPAAPVLTASIDACLANGARLIDDAYQVEFQEPPATKQMLAMISQEECAKAFLLFLVREGLVPWSRELYRATNDHTCKQLIAVIFDYIDPQWEEVEEIKKLISDEYDRDGRLPTDVSTALNVLRHEKIGRWESRSWEWAEQPNYDKSVLKIAEGKRDRIKQDALYVRLGHDAQVTSRPEDTKAEAADAELDRANHYLRFVRTIVERGWHDDIFHRKVREAFRLLFDGAK